MEVFSQTNGVRFANLVRCPNLQILTKMEVSMEELKEDYAIIDNYLCVKMPGEIDHHSAAVIRENADRLLLDDKVKNIVFDFENTTFMDSSGLGIIIGRYKKISCFGGRVYAVNANERICKMLTTSGMSAIIKIM